jgi:hypothetical protein
MRRFFLLVSLALSTAAFADSKPRCWECVSGTFYYNVPVSGQTAQSSRESISAESLRVCRIIIHSWNRNPNDCSFKSCHQFACDNDASAPTSPFCNSNASCGFGSLCIGGRCVDKQDPFANKCTSDSQCGGKFDRGGHCRLGRCE